MPVQPGEIWVADIPFTDGTASKRRPVLVLWLDGADLVAAAVTSAARWSATDVVSVGCFHHRGRRRSLTRPTCRGSGPVPPECVSWYHQSVQQFDLLGFGVRVPRGDVHAAQVLVFGLWSYGLTFHPRQQCQIAFAPKLTA